jgi:cobalt-zinc-cadmium efflux system protein
VQLKEMQNAVASDRNRLLTVLAVTALYCAGEFIGGYYSNSLALITDAVHLLTDIAALCLALLTLKISTLPASGAKTYGYLRAEILGALANGLFLWLLVIFIWFEAVQRLRNPYPVAGLPVIAIATVGLIVNGFSAWMTHAAETAAEAGRPGRPGMAVRAVFVHVMSDLIGTFGVMLSGALVFFFGWHQADAVVSLLIGALVLYSSWGLVREGVDILMESVPAHIDLEELRHDLLAIRDTEEVHDLHVWCLASRQFALSAHAVVTREADQDRVLSEMSAMLERKFNVRHMTVQLERDSRRASEPEHF